MNRAASALGLAALLALAPPSGAAADPAGGHVVVAVVPGPGGAVEGAVVVGRSGEVFEPGPDGLERRVAGGVASDVGAAVRGDDGVLWAIGRRAPPYRRDPGGVWHAAPLGNRGAITAPVAGGARFVLGRHLYGLDGARWRRLATAPAGIARLAVAGRRSWLALSDGRVARHDGAGRLTVSASPLAAGDAIAWLAADGDGAVLRSASGRWQRLSARGGRPIDLALPPTLNGFEPAVADANAATTGGAGFDPGGGRSSRRVDRDGTAGLFVVGGMPGTPAGARRLILARVEARALVLVEDLAPPLGPGDVFAALVADGQGGLLLATAGGEVRRRPRGGSLTAVPLVDALPPAAPAAR